VIAVSQLIFYPINHSPVLNAAGEALKRRGYGVVDQPCESVTHLLLPVPSFDDRGNVKGGGDLDAVLAKLPKNITVIGGKIPKDRFPGHKTIDLLKDPTYLADNAAITAYCAVRLAMMELPVMLRGCRVLIIGWGRIGRCLAALLWALEADVTIAARGEDQRAMAHALGYHAEDTEQLGHNLNGFRLIFNTAPAPVLSEEQISHCRDNCLKIDLASALGIAGKHVIWARGLPGRDTPESSGKLIAKTVIRHLDRKELEV
jgi:dipicolinate synthase subunit A